MPDSKTYRWQKIDHPERVFWGVPVRVPWPVEVESKPDPKVGYPAGDLREGVRRLRAEGGAEWTQQWAALEAFCDRGDELGKLLESGELAAAVGVLDELEALRPGTGYCPFNLGFVHESLGDLPAARAALVLAIERMPKVEWAWTRRAAVHEKLGEKEDAIFCHRKALALLPRHQQALEGLARLGAMVRLVTHWPGGKHQIQYFTPKDFRERTEREVARLPPDHANLRSMLAQARKHNDGGLSLLLLDRILSGQPADALDLRIQRADALRQLKRLPEARELIDEILGGHPNHAEALYVRAWCCFDERKIGRGWRLIDEVLAADCNHQKAIMVKFKIGTEKKDPGTVVRLAAWAEQHRSWRGYWCAAIQCSTHHDPQGCLRWAEAACRLAPTERDAVFLYANSLNNADETERTAALIHPQLPHCPGDWQLKYMFAGAMKKLGLKEEAVRVLREALAEESEITLKWQQAIRHFLDELTGHLATGEIEIEFHPNTGTLRRDIWLANDEGPQLCHIGAGQPAPIERSINMQPPEGTNPSTGSINFLFHSEGSTLDPIDLGWFRVHELDYPTAKEPPLFTLRVTKKGKLEGFARQDDRPLPVTWSLYRVPSMENEPPREA